MKKDAFYFPHYSNARNDSKLIKLRRVLGIEGYGMYFLLLEVLREQGEFRLPITSLEDFAFEWHTSKEKLQSVVNDFDLFVIHNDTFFSPKLIEYLTPYLEKSERARVAANKRWNNGSDANAYANALPEHSKCNADQNAINKRDKRDKRESYHTHAHEELFDLTKFKDPNAYTDDQKKELANRIYEDLKNSQKWIEDVCRATGLSKSESWHRISEFFDELVSKDDYYKSIREIKKHCVSWLKKHQPTPVINGR